MGILTTAYAGIFAGPVFKGEMAPGTTDFISGSGSVSSFLREMTYGRGLTLSNVITVGNSAQKGVEDILGMFDDAYGSAGAPNMMLYMEQIKKPAKLMRHAKSLTKKGCSLVAIKSGTTQAGMRAAASHTGALATNDIVVNAMFEKAGIIRVAQKREMVDVLAVLTAVGNEPVRRVCIVTEAGGPGVMLTDELERQGVEVPLLQHQTRERLRNILDPAASVGNPVDCMPSKTPEQLRQIFEIIADEEKDGVDAIAVIMGDPLMDSISDVYDVIGHAMDNNPIPVIPVLTSVVTSHTAIEKFRSSGKFFFQDEVDLGRALGKVSRRPKVTEPVVELENYNYQPIAEILATQGEIVTPEATDKVLKAAGFQTPKQREIREKSTLTAACRNIGFPLVMKIIGPLHKSDLGGVKIGIKDESEADDAWEELRQISGFKGALVQRVVSGVEVILGATREEGYGHLIMFGFGGVYAEVMGDVKFALAPLSREESHSMITGIRSYPILEGFRGEKGVSLTLLSDYLLRLSRMVTDFPHIKEIDFNPVKGAENNLYIVDAGIIKDAET